MDVKFNTRNSGILMHISSLPGKYGIGSFGKEAYDFVDFLHDSGQKLWQILPLVHTGTCNSPYKGLSAFAINPIFINIDWLLTERLIEHNDLSKISFIESNHIDYLGVSKYIIPILNKASEQFLRNKSNEEDIKFNEFCCINNFWLNDYAQFIAFKTYFCGKPWNLWDKRIKFRKKAEFDELSVILNQEIEKYKVIQYLLFIQWQKIKDYANKKGISIIGDIPLYVDYDSADVWVNPEYFILDADLEPLFISGVPPDYFSKTGQLWGNPVYNWDNIVQHDFLWWHQRLFNNCRLFDLVRIDHFRGLESFWAIPAKAIDAKCGQWIAAPGEIMLNEFCKKYNRMPFIAEDLGFISEEVIKLRDKFNLPGMKILQFGFDSEDSRDHLPHNHIKNCIVYTGTHDNNTILGWYKTIPNEVKNYFNSYGNFFNNSEPSWKMIEMAWSSIAYYSLTTMQDLLCLDEKSRMNTPGNSENNWTWKCKTSDLSDLIATKLLKLTKKYDR